MARTSKIVAAIGPKGSGKSFWAKSEVRRLRKRVFIFDSTLEYVSTGKEGIPGLVVHDGVRGLAKYAQSHGVDGKHSVRGSWRDFRAFCAFVYRLGHSTVLFEELSAYGAEIRKSREFRDVENRSRHRNLDLLLIGHRPTSLTPNLRGQVDTYKVFKTDEPVDLEFWSKRTGNPATRDRIRSLPKYKHLSL